MAPQVALRMTVFDAEGSIPDDPVYAAGSGQFDTPKESFKFILGLIGAKYGDRPISLLDVGCAAGAFVHHARRLLNVQEAVGMDSASALLAVARTRQPDVEFVEDSIAAPSRIRRQFDVTTSLGVVSIFDDLAPVLANLWSFVRPGGSLYIADLGNDDPVDVVMRYRLAAGPSEWRSGFNIRSRITYERLVHALDPSAAVSWHDFEMPFAIPKTDPMRAWTIRTEHRRHQEVVGTCQLLNVRIIEIDRPA